MNFYLNKMRNEIKYTYKLADAKPLESFLKSNYCKEIFHERIVNSLYYDTRTKDLYTNAENGISQRYKARIRFNGLGESGYQIEYKYRDDQLNYKTYAQNNTNQPGSNLPILCALNRLFVPKFPSKLNTYLLPNTLVYYSRKYFLTQSESIRIT